MDLLDEIQETKKEDKKSVEFDFNPTALFAGIIQTYNIAFPNAEDFARLLNNYKANLELSLPSKKIKKKTEKENDIFSPVNFYLFHSLPHNYVAWQNADKIVQSVGNAHFPLLKHYLRLCNQNTVTDIVQLVLMAKNGYEIPFVDKSPSEVKEYAIIKGELNTWVSSKSKIDEKIKKLIENSDVETAKGLVQVFEKYDWISADLKEESDIVKKTASSEAKSALKKIKELVEVFGAKIKVDYFELIDCLDIFSEKMNSRNPLNDEYIKNILDDFVDSLIKNKSFSGKLKNSSENKIQKLLDKNIETALINIFEEIKNEERNAEEKSRLQNKEFRVGDEVIVSKITTPHVDCWNPNECSSSLYYYNVNARQVHLKSTGKVNYIEEKDKIYVRFSNNYEYAFHPSELSFSDKSRQKKSAEKQNDKIENLVDKLLSDGKISADKKSDVKKERREDSITDLLEMANEELLVKAEAEQKGFDSGFLLGVYGAKSGALEKAREKLPVLFLKKLKEVSPATLKNRVQIIVEELKKQVKQELCVKYRLESEDELNYFSVGNANYVFDKYKSIIFEKNQYELRAQKAESLRLNDVIGKAKEYLEDFEKKNA